MIYTHEQFPDVDWCGLAINRGEGFGSRLIAQASVSKWWLLLPFPRILDSVASHVRVIFGKGDKTLFYFEAREFDSEGWIGPHSERQAVEWAAGNPRRWTRRYRYVPATQDQVRAMWQACISQRGHWHYDALQNLGVWWHRWTGRRLPLQERGVNCSEAAARLWFMQFSEMLSDKPMDLVTPYDVQRVLVGPTWQVVP
jgi:hypothetical protein